MTRRLSQIHVALLCIAVSAPAIAQVCDPQPHTFTESFNDRNYMDTANSNIGRWGQGEVTLKSKSTVFEGLQSSFGQRVYVLAPGDFNADGWKDMFALMLDPSCHLHFMQNLKMTGSPPVHAGFSMGGALGSSGFNKWIIDSPPGCSTESPVLVSGDFDKDGDTDALYMRVTNESNAGSLSYAYLYRFDGYSNGAPVFVRFDVLSDFAGHNIAWHWTSTPVQSIDWDGDGRTDVVIGSSYGNVNQVLLFKAKSVGLGFEAPVTLIANAGLATPIASSSQTASGNSSCPPAVSRGINAVMAGDFDKDNDIDVIVGSTSEKGLKYWKNSGNNTFFSAGTIAFNQGGASVGMVGDFDGDGDLDFEVGRDGWNCNGIGGTLWLYLNDGTGAFTQKTTAIANGGDDLDFGAAFQIDNDLGNKIDSIVADGNNSGAYNQTISDEADIYLLTGDAVSTTVDTINAASEAIVSVKITNITSSNTTAPANSIAYYVSPDNGQNWEPLTTAELPPTSATHDFVHFGSDLRWKAVLTSQAETLTGDEAALAPGSKDTPRLLELAFTYHSVERRRYSRAGLAFASVPVNGAPKEVLYGASFLYPGFQATLTAFDISKLPQGAATNTTLERVDTSVDVSVLWEAGALLAARTASQRVIYAGYANSTQNDGIMNDRVSVNVSQLTSPTTVPSLQTMMGLADVDKVDVLNFVLGARGDVTGWKLYHIDHSTPVVVGGPSGDSSYLGTGYDDFKTANANRTPLVYVGANDGMLHAFNAATGAEEWAFIPNNLLAKIKTQRVVTASGEDYLPGAFIDGAIAVADVRDNVTWKTLLVSGQGAGQSPNTNNYYFALNITDPTNPQPLWEFTDPSDDRGAICSGQPCTTNCVQVCQPPVCTAGCSSPNRMFSQSGSAVAMEAEHYNTNSRVASPHDWVLTADASASGGEYMKANPNNGTSCRNNSFNSCGAHMVYSIKIDTSGNYYPNFLTRANSNQDDAIMWGLDGSFEDNMNTGPDNNTWAWNRGNSFYIGAGEHVFDVWMKEDGLSLDKIVLTTSSSTTTGTGPAETCQSVCAAPVCTNNCTTTCIQPGQEWPECGVGAAKHCCNLGDVNNYCIPLAKACGPDIDPVLGETWSPPTIGRVLVGSTPRWLVFVGSGYINRNLTNVGRSIYALDAMTGAIVGRWDLNDLATSGTNPSTIPNTIPGGAKLVDVDNDGFVDRLYIGDLEGRLWKIEMSKPGVIDGEGRLSHTTWPSCVLFDAGDPEGDGVRTWAPIITKPGAALLAGTTPNLYFGTGGDDRVPDNLAYRFYSVRDTDVVGTCRATPLRMADLSIDELEWVVGDGKENSPNPTTGAALNPADEEGNVGDRYWADPLIVNNADIYFSSLPGKIDVVNPCLGLGGVSKVYGYSMTVHTNAAGVQVLPGQSLFSSPWLAASSKIRQAAVLRGPLPDQVAHQGNATSAGKNDVFIQEFSGTNASDSPSIRRISDGGLAAGGGYIKVLRWREIPL